MKLLFVMFACVMLFACSSPIETTETSGITVTLNVDAQALIALCKTQRGALCDIVTDDTAEVARITNKIEGSDIAANVDIASRLVLGVMETHRLKYTMLEHATVSINGSHFRCDVKNPVKGLTTMTCEPAIST